MPFSSNPLLAPVFQSPVGDGRDHRPPVVSIKRAEDAVESGVRLHHNQRVEGYILQPEVEGLGVAPVELQTAPLASGGSVARHARLTEGDVFLPITLASPVPSALPSMFDALVDIARPGQRDEDGLPYQFEVVVFDPYGQETRSRRLIFESGLGDPVRVNHHVWRTSITGRFVDPYWYGTVRELRRTLGSVDKKFITAHPGRPAEGQDTITYEWEGEPHASPSVKRVNGVVVARNLAINGDLSNDTHGWTINSHSSLVSSPQFANAMWRNLGYEESDGPLGRATLGNASVLAVSQINNDFQESGFIALAAFVATESNAGVRSTFGFRTASGTVIRNVSSDFGSAPFYDGRRLVHVAEIPANTGQLTVQLNLSGSQGHRLWFDKVQYVVAATEAEALAQVAEYWDGDSPDVVPLVGAYEFPFFPVRIGGSVVQGEYELQVEGDAPAYWSGVITPPGEDLLIQNAKGERIFVQGRVDEPILIQTRPQEQDITLADGTPIWDRIDPGDDDFFPLHPGKNTVHVSMVGATQQSEILIRYREAFFHSLGGGR